jgi:lipoprotein-releasing system permease protein
VVHFGLINRPGTRPPPSPLLGRGALQGGDTPFLFVIGIDPESEQATTSLADWLRAPSPEHRVADLDAPLAARDGLPTILLGEARMTAAGLRPGDIVVMNTAHTEAGPDGSGVEKIEVQLAEDGSRGAPRFVVAGAYRTRHTGYDGNNAFVDIEVLRRLLGMPEDLVQEIVIALHDRATTEQTAERLDRAVRRELDQERMPSQRGARTQSWRTWNFAFLRNVEWQRSLMKIVLIVIMAVAAVLMFATLSMMVTEKTGDIGILTAMGASPRGVMFVFLACGLLITAAGIVLGTVLGCLSAVYLEEFRQFVMSLTGIDLFPVKVYNLDRVPYDLNPMWMLQVAAMAAAVGILVSALPALRAARHDPLQSLRGI